MCFKCKNGTKRYDKLSTMIGEKRWLKMLKASHTHTHKCDQLVVLIAVHIIKDCNHNCDSWLRRCVSLLVEVKVLRETLQNFATNSWTFWNIARRIETLNSALWNCTLSSSIFLKLSSLSFNPLKFKIGEFWRLAQWYWAPWNQPHQNQAPGNLAP